MRIPSSLAFDSEKTEVEIERQGDDLIIRPTKRRLTGIGQSFRRLGPYFENFRRDQPPIKLRDWDTQNPDP